MAGYDFITETGVIVPDTADIKAAVEAEFREALGERMSTAPDSPQGRLISTETAARAFVARNNALLANQINPNLATGVYLDALAALLGITRKQATKSIINNVRLTGTPLVKIAAGSRARSRAGDLFESSRDVVLDTAGRAIVDFVAVDTGAIACAQGDLSTLVDAVLGWETVYNSNAAVVGGDIQSDVSLRLERQMRLANQGISTMEAQISGLYAVDGVKSLSFQENISHDYQVINGIRMKPHSVWACVHGGLDADIAMSLLKHKTDGAAWNGAVETVIIEPSADIPYTVLFDRPKEVKIDLHVTISKGTVEQVKTAIMQYASGKLEGERGLVVGGNVSPFELAGAINLFSTAIFVRSIKICRSGEPPAAAEITIAPDELPSITEENISVTINT
ncbi:baseplate J/gp47 family protein [Serratia microhaemolytica]|uniref:baseplate J/gp47 family protein n=1 Tax=Serratia microhaemolytica TaxID=2675110 RepID=UPI000FDE65F7|nr:baseplate J/gp47 family protein [Serratia microhaemolytica]